jgi:tetratricopeptide (TPR) repeat protein
MSRRFGESGTVSNAGPGGERPATNAPGDRGNVLSGSVRGPAVQAGSIHGDVTFQIGPASASTPVPAQLLPAPVHFTGRVTELDLLHRLVNSTSSAPPVILAVVSGSGGIGKTSLVLRWLHDLRDRYPGGQLYADLGGHSPPQAAQPGDVLGRFLRALGIASARVPDSLEEQAGLYRSVTSGRPLIVMLDNAASAAQVRTLLPGPGPSLVAVTTRWRLAGLAIDGATFTELGPLPEPDAIELLDRVAGSGRARAEPGAAREVVRLCGCLALAVCVTGAQLAPHPSWPVGRIAAELAGERDRLSALSLSEDVSVRATFDVSYRALPPEAARAYRLLSLIPGPDFCSGLAAAAADAEPGAVNGLLDVLTGASLLTETGPDRFRFHDLVRLHARAQANADPAATRDTVVRRAVGWYLDRAVAADLVVMPGRWRLGPRYDQARHATPEHPNPAAALGWLESELPGLLAALDAAAGLGMHEEVWQLCEALWGLFLNHKHFTQWITSHQTGVASAHACGNRRAEARVRTQLGYCYLNQRQCDAATAELEVALELDRQEGHLLGEATALEHLGQADLGLGRPTAAIERFARARDIHAEIGRPRGVALLTRRIAEAHREAGRYQDALAGLAEARRRYAAVGDPFGEARALTGLGQTLLRAGRPEQASGPLGEALAMMTTLGARYEQARIHSALGEAAAVLDDPATARRHLQTALDIYTETGAPEADEVRQHHSALGLAPAPPPDTASDTDTPAS